MKPKMLTSTASEYLNITLPAVHKQLKSKPLLYTKSKNRVYFEHKTAKEIFKLKFNPSCWSWQNLKGGVGKTHLSFATAIRLTLYGAKVLVLDLDQQGNFTQACNIDAENKPVLIDIINDELDITEAIVPVIDGLDIIPSRIENAVLDNFFAVNSLPVDRTLKKRIDQLKSNYDFIFIDCPPSLGQAVSAASLAADCIIVPVDPEKFSLSGLNITLTEIEKNISKKFDVNLRIKIILNKFDARTSLSHQMLSTLLNNPEYKKRMFKTFVRTNQDLPNSVAQEKSIFDSLRKTTAKEDIDLLAREFIEDKKINSDSRIQITSCKETRGETLICPE